MCVMTKETESTISTLGKRRGVTKTSITCLTTRLKDLGADPSCLFVTSLLELKLDPDTKFEWQCHNQETADVPHFTMLLEFLVLCAEASEAIVLSSYKGSSQSHHRSQHVPKPIATFATNTSDSE